MSKAHPNPPDDSADQELQVFLAAGDAELLEHVRTHANPTRALTALLASDKDASPVPTASRPVPSAQGSEELHLHARIVSRTIIGDLDNALDLAHELAIEINRPRSHTSAGARVGARVRIRALIRDLDRIRDLILNLADDLDSIRVMFHVRIRDLDSARDCARDLDRDLARGLARVRVRALIGSLIRACNHARALDQDLLHVQLNVSGANLTALQLTAANLTVLAGVVWDETTQWPPRLRSLIQSRSEEIEPGRYRVRDGTERDPHEAARR